MGEEEARIPDSQHIYHLDEVDRRIVASVILGVDITELYSPERVAKVARKYGLAAGSSMDLTADGT